MRTETPVNANEAWTGYPAEDRMALMISQSHWTSLRQHGEETFPHECCGVLVGVFDGEGSKVVRDVVRCDNQRPDSPHNRYFIDPRDLARIQRQAYERGEEIVGFYHSHPQHPARWSPTDLEEAHWPGCSYVITSVMDGAATQTNSFQLVAREDSKSFQDEEAKIV
jgi:proteasome lid subunit RPN8/RPN11